MSFLHFFVNFYFQNSKCKYTHFFNQQLHLLIIIILIYFNLTVLIFIIITTTYDLNYLFDYLFFFSIELNYLETSSHNNSNYHILPIFESFLFIKFYLLHLN